jgi:hypothetical protein
MRFKSLRYVLSALALFAALVLATRLLHAEANPPRQFRIEGGWLFTVTPPEGSPGPASFVALDTFAAGGGWSGVSSADAPTAVSPGHGTWKYTKDSIVVTQVAFAYDSVGSPTGRIVIHKQVHFTGPDSVEGTSTISFCDLAGENCFSPPGHAEVSAVRIPAQGPDQ